MASPASHAVLYEENYKNINFAKATFSPFPSNLSFNVKRTCRPIMNDHFKNHLYLTAAPLPSEEREEMSAIKQSENDPVITEPLKQIQANIDSMERSINKKIEALHEMGMEGYVNKHMNEAKKAGSDAAVVCPEDTESMAGCVVATTEHKVKPAARKRKSTLLPIMAHDVNHKNRKK